MGIYSINRYYSEFVSTNKIEPLVSIRTEDGISYFEYLVLDADTGGNNRCVAVIYKTDTDFLIVQFETSQRNYPRYIEQIKNWAKSVTFES